MSTTYLLEKDMTPSSSSSTTVDPDNRDPTGMNKHLRLDFFNVIAEPDTSAYSFPALHQVSHHVYHYSKLFMYRFLTIIIGLPLMFLWGLTFGLYSFAMIWLAVPMRRLWQSAIAEAGVYIGTISEAIIAPIYRSVGLMFSNIHLSLFHHAAQPSKTVNV